MSLLPVLSINEFPEEEAFYANDFQSHIKAHHQNINSPHKHDFYMTILFTQGSGVHEVDFHSYKIKKGVAFMLNPGQTHNWKFSADTNGYVLFHTKAFYNLTFANRSVESFPFFYSSHNNPCLYIAPDKLGLFEHLFSNIIEEHRSNRMLRHQKIGSLIDILYIELTREYLVKDSAVIKTSPKIYQDKLRLLEDLIDKNFIKHKAASYYAEKMYMSIRHLNRIVQAGLGKTTTELITERILLEAQRILAHSTLTVAEVAYKLGYDDHSYFSRLFKKKLGISPSDFAKLYNELR